MNSLVEISTEERVAINCIVRSVAGEVMAEKYTPEQYAHVSQCLRSLIPALTYEYNSTLTSKETELIISFLEWRIRHCNNIRISLEQIAKRQEGSSSFLYSVPKEDCWCLRTPTAVDGWYNHSTYLAMNMLKNDLIIRLIDIKPLV